MGARDGNVQTEATPRARSKPPLGAIIRVAGTGTQFRLERGRCVIGAVPPADVVVADPRVSRTHAEIEIVAEGVRVRDLDSRNGTFYLDQPIKEMTLALGGRIRVGSTEIIIDADPDALGSAPTYADDTYRDLVGPSLAMRKLFARLERLEGSLATVLVEGESGTGKELVATALHEGSEVAGGPFVAINCGAFSRELVASELFGHRRGAFTGALEARRGAFEAADGGTLFLDEIGELPLDVQPMLLRVLETSEVRPLGEDTSKHVSVRIVSATNRDLEAEVAAGRFREDLFYRLAVVRVRIPPLRERPEDVDALAHRFAAACGKTLDEETLAKLRGRAWKGNARELKNAIQAFAALGVFPESGERAAQYDTGFEGSVDPTRPYADQKEEVVDRFTRAYLRALMKRARGNQTAAAKMAGLDRTYLGRLLAKYDVED
jgi:DNA-binding NtrC family response regulator